jgi:4-carboxymuconolactone decarboxylase
MKMAVKSGEKTHSHGSKAEEVEGAVGYLPSTYMEFVRDYPDISKAYADLSKSCHKAGPLDKKTRRLIKLGISIGISSEGAVRSHARRALEEGISPEEIRHTVLLAFTTTGFPNMIAAHKWVEEVLKKAK